MLYDLADFVVFEEWVVDDDDSHPMLRVVVSISGKQYEAVEVSRSEALKNIAEQIQNATN